MRELLAKRRLNAAWLALLFVAAGLHFASFEVLENPIGLDTAFFLHFAERTAQGAVPYRDFLEYKTPLAIFAGSLAYRAGEALGLDPLMAIRVLFLGLASCTAVATGAVLYHAANRRIVAAWFGVLGYAGFGILGSMPAIGNVPKQIVMLCAMLALLQAHRRRWVACGVLVALAGMDWQVGGALAALGALAMALAGRRRTTAVARLGLGCAVGLLPFLAYFAVQGALPQLLEQTVVLPATRLGVDRHTGWDVARILELIQRAASPDLLLCWLAVAGVLLGPVWALRARRSARLPLMLGLCTYHGLVVLWSTRSFAGRGDLFLLLGSLAFFGALTLTTLYLLALARLRPLRVRLARAAGVPAAVAVLATVLMLHPSRLGGERRWDESVARPPYDLSEQREVAREFARMAAGRRVACLASQELLFLERVPEVLGILYYENTVRSYLNEEGQSGFDSLISSLNAADPTLVVLPRWFRLGKEEFNWETSRKFVLKRLSSRRGNYAVDVWVAPR